MLLWHYPDTSRVPLALQTEHRANLFGVALLPFSNNTRVVTGAMDYTVQLHEIGEGGCGWCGCDLIWCCGLVLCWAVPNQESLGVAQDGRCSLTRLSVSHPHSHTFLTCPVDTHTHTHASMP